MSKVHVGGLNDVI